jgi:hypothetical protein
MQAAAVSAGSTDASSAAADAALLLWLAATRSRTLCTCHLEPTTVQLPSVL